MALFKRTVLKGIKAVDLKTQLKNLMEDQKIIKAKEISIRNKTFIQIETKKLYHGRTPMGSYYIKIPLIIPPNRDNGFHISLKRKEGRIYSSSSHHTNGYRSHCTTNGTDTDNNTFQGVCLGTIKPQVYNQIRHKNYEMAAQMIINLLETTNTGFCTWTEFKAGLITANQI